MYYFLTESRQNANYKKPFRIPSIIRINRNPDGWTTDFTIRYVVAKLALRD